MNRVLKDIEMTVARVETEAAITAAQSALFDLANAYEDKGLMQQCAVCEIAAYDLEHAREKLEKHCR